MKLILDTDVNVNYIQTLCMIFFPGAKFAQDEVVTDETPVVTVTTKTEEDKIYAFAKIQVGEQAVSAEYTQPIKDGDEKRAGKIAVGKAVFKAGESFFGYTPAWGILTGIRPAKISRQLYESLGGSEFHVKKALRHEYFLNPKKAALLNDVTVNEQRIIQSLKPDSCSLYISIPFCPTRCAYCSFVSYATKKLQSLIPDYLARLLQDIDMVFGIIREKGLKLSTVYIGGGTPTTLTASQLSMIFDKIAEHVDPATLDEFTCEAGRPDTITEDKVKCMIDAGVTRMSINPQTLNDEVLLRIGRRHTSEDFFKAYDIARSLGIQYINTDLIAGLPGDSYRSFSKSVDTILKMRPDNLTIHTFCIKKSADFAAGSGLDNYAISGGEAQKSVDYSQVKAKLAGYIPYYIYRQKNTVGNLENVGFSLPGAEGIYNVLIMEELQHIFAVGAGSVTKLVSRPAAKIERYFMPKYPFEYLKMTEEEIRAQYTDKIDRFFETYRDF
ncbi:MAG: coproporphyrinogen dehydrogenase HemZ [Clostridia bacterium]|nr:coproporphyrinogen dehydrogenase HemZ [Clostridia bacterium]